MDMRRLFIIIFALGLMGLMAQAENILTVYDALSIAEKNDVGGFVSVINNQSWWQIKGVNQNNRQPCELRIDQETGIIEYCVNVTPKDIVIGENTYGFAGKTYEKTGAFVDKGVIVNGFRIYINNDRMFQMRQAIFIQNKNQLIAYNMYQGPDLIKSSGRSGN